MNSLLNDSYTKLDSSYSAAQIADVSQKVSGQSRVKVLACYTRKGPLSLAGGPDSLAMRIVKAAGSENVFADQDPYPDASLEPSPACINREF